MYVLDYSTSKGRFGSHLSGTMTLISPGGDETTVPLPPSDESRPIIPPVPAHKATINARIKGGSGGAPSYNPGIALYELPKFPIMPAFIGWYNFNFECPNRSVNQTVPLPGTPALNPPGLVFPCQ